MDVIYALSQAWCSGKADSEFELLEKYLTDLKPEESILVGLRLGLGACIAVQHATRSLVPHDSTNDQWAPFSGAHMQQRHMSEGLEPSRDQRSQLNVAVAHNQADDHSAGCVLCHSVCH